MAKQIKRNAKRAYRQNPREDRNYARPQNSAAPTNDNDGGYAPRQPAIKKKVELLPRNIAQEDYVDNLLDESKHIVFAMGPAGCGKTLLATLAAIKALQAKEVDKIVITRPAVSTDEQHGFLPGDLRAKMAPWVIPIMDVFDEHFSKATVDRWMEDGTIDIAPLAFMRGRSLKRAIVIVDESQNTTPNQMKMVLTRIGEGSRMFVTGDLEQHDRGFTDNGLKDFVTRLERKGSEAIAVNRFAAGDVERHPIIEEILSIYED